MNLVCKIKQLFCAWIFFSSRLCLACLHCSMFCPSEVVESWSQNFSSACRRPFWKPMHCIARQALHRAAGIALAPALPPTSWEGMRQYIFNLCERWAPFQAIIMPTDVYRSNFFAVKRIVFACEHFLLPFESICSWDAYAWQSMLPLQLFIFDTTTLCMLALMADDCRSSSYVLNVHLHPLTPFYLQSTSFFGWDQPLSCASQWAWLHHEDPTPWSFSILFSYIDILYR